MVFNQTKSNYWSGSAASFSNWFESFTRRADEQMGRWALASRKFKAPTFAAFYYFWLDTRLHASLFYFRQARHKTTQISSSPSKSFNLPKDAYHLVDDIQSLQFDFQLKIHFWLPYKIIESTTLPNRSHSISKMQGSHHRHQRGANVDTGTRWEKLKYAEPTRGSNKSNRSRTRRSLKEFWKIQKERKKRKFEQTDILHTHTHTETYKRENNFYKILGVLCRARVFCCWLLQKLKEKGLKIRKRATSNGGTCWPLELQGWGARALRSQWARLRISHSVPHLPAAKRRSSLTLPDEPDEGRKKWKEKKRNCVPDGRRLVGRRLFVRITWH